MKTFAQFLEEIEDHPKFKRDNPGGDWLRRHQDAAEKDYDESKGARGGTTGYFNKNLHLPVKELHPKRALALHKPE